LAETKVSDTRTYSNSLGKRRQNIDDVVASKRSALHDVNSTPIVARSEQVIPATTATVGTSQPLMLESSTVNEISYNHGISSLESSQPNSSKLSQSDHISDWSTQSQMVPTALIASLPSVPHMFQLIHTQPAAASPTELASSVHPLLSMVQQVIPPLHDYTPLVPFTHALYPSHGSPPQSQQAVQSSYHDMDQLPSSSSSTQPVSVLQLFLTFTCF